MCGGAVSQFSDVKAFVELANKATGIEALAEALGAVLQQLGFDFHALGHHVDLLLPPEKAVQIVHYPPAWFERVLAERTYIDDPVLLAAQRSATGFFWTDVPKLLNLTANQKETLAQAAKQGLGAGYTVPVNVPGEYMGSIHLAVRTGRSLPEESLPAAQYVTMIAFECARRLQLRRAGLARPAMPMPLSPRQRDCLKLVAQGLNDKQIARSLGISPHTARGYVAEAMREYGTTKRTQLVIRALFEGELAFADIVSPPRN